MHHMVSVVGDVLFVNGVGFLVITSMNINFTTMQYIAKRMTRNLSQPLYNIKEVYYKGGMYAETYYMDRDFYNLRGAMC